MTPDHLATLATFAATCPILLVGHNVADHVAGQNDWMAANKATPGMYGWAANLAHVAAYHAVITIIAGICTLTLPLAWTPAGITAALAVSVVTHAMLDRRWPVRALLDHTGCRDFARLAGHGMNGMYLADQALHHTALLICAVLLTAL